MKEFSVFLTGVSTGFLVFLLVTWDWPMDGQVGKTYEELKEMKEECEKSLPRDKVCKAEIKFVIEE